MFLRLPIISFKINETYDRTRAIADGIIISLIKYGSNRCTYASTVRLSLGSRISIWWKADNPYNSACDDAYRIMSWRVNIYHMCGNRKSILSASENQIFDEIIAVNEMEHILERLEIGKEKNNEGLPGN